MVKKGEIDVSKLEVISQVDYEAKMIESIMAARKVLDDLVNLYNTYEILDKPNYRLTFYRNPKNNIYMYIRDKKSKIGFKQNDI